MSAAPAGALVTGAGGGIGRLLCQRLLADGVDVLAVGRRSAALALIGEPAVGGRLQRLSADVTVAADRERIAEAVRQQQRPLRWLVHAAAVASFGLFAAGDDTASERLLATNVLAPLALTRRLLPQLRAHPQAAVVAIGSTFGSIGFPGYADYCASKFALRGLFEALAREHADAGPRFLWLAPRATATAFNSAAVDALNRELGSAVDAADAVAGQIVEALSGRAGRRQFGWPERWFVRLNGAFPELVDRALRRQLPIIRRHAAGDPPVNFGDA